MLTIYMRKVSMVHMSQSVPHSKHSPPELQKTNLLIFHKEKVSFYSEISTKYSGKYEVNIKFNF